MKKSISSQIFYNCKCNPPFRGEINTIRGNADRMLAREETMLSPCMAEDMDKVLPVISRNGSDSAMLDRNGLRPARYYITKDRRLIAAGVVGCQSYVAEALGLPRDSRGNLVTENYMTPTEGIFAAGDCRRGQSLVAWSIAEGRACARAVDQYLMGYTNML